MTREEAIERMKTMRWEHATNPSPDREAFDMAISALEKEDDTTSWEYDEINSLHICKRCGMSELWEAKFCPNCGRKAVQK